MVSPKLRVPANAGRRCLSQQNTLPDGGCCPLRGYLGEYGTPMPCSVPFPSSKELCRDSREVGLLFSSAHHPDHRDQQACTQAPGPHNSERQVPALIFPDLQKGKLRQRGIKDSCTEWQHSPISSHCVRKEIRAAVGSHRLPLKVSNANAVTPKTLGAQCSFSAAQLTLDPNSELPPTGSP